MMPLQGHSKQKPKALGMEYVLAISLLLSASHQRLERDTKELDEKNHIEEQSVDSDPKHETDEVLDKEPIPTLVVPIYKRRLVLLKIGNNFLRLGTGPKPVVSKLKPPLIASVNADELERLLDRKRPPKPVPENFDYPAFTFVADETATVTESWYRRTRIFFHIRLSVQRWGTGGPTEYLCSSASAGNQQARVVYDKLTFGSWWRLTAVANSQFVAESLHLPGRCLATGPSGLCLSAPLTEKEKVRIAHGRWDRERTVTVVTLPDFAVTHPGVIVS